ncbi:hypothetical protein B4135_0978 [Caldibacillus debilis]|uniref:Uncharacterized protein n=1 Tax=Caldibacillus debilis TaxID=301148 RepID=A0A150MFR6_9BACI|nr:hypothetical protein B4135_0978 [Caldibacillus debilis]
MVNIALNKNDIVGAKPFIEELHWSICSLKLVPDPRLRNGILFFI